MVRKTSKEAKDTLLEEVGATLDWIDTYVIEVKDALGSSLVDSGEWGEVIEDLRRAHAETKAIFDSMKPPNAPAPVAFNVCDVILPVGGFFPQHALQVHGIGADGSIHVAALGGGWEKTIPPEKQHNFRRVEPEDQTCVWHRGHYDMDGMDGPFPGFDCGRRWNGWSCPSFTKEVAERVLAAFVGDNLYPFIVWRYDAENDRFVWVMDNTGNGWESVAAAEAALEAGPEAEGDGDRWYFNVGIADDIIVDGKIVHVYGIGDCDYCWNDVEVP